MMFTFLVATAATQAVGLRPGVSSTNFAKLRDLAKAGRSDVAVLHEIAGVVNSIMLQEGNATEHLTSDDQALLNRVIDMINNNMYASMTSAHNGDVSALNAAIAAINQCSMDWNARIADGGDLYVMHQGVIQYQNTLNQLQDDVDEKTVANATAWSNLESHMSLISAAPQCPAFPNPRTMASLDVYFDTSAYVTWWTAQKAAYEPVRDAYVYANHQLELALTAYAVGLGQRDTAYCDWKRELEHGCQQYETCYRVTTEHYGLVVKPAVEEDMRARIEAYKAGETIIHQIKFLLAQEADQATPAISTSRYQIAFPDVPAKQECDLSPLDDARWVPTPVCVGAGPMPDFESRPQNHNLGNCAIYRDTLPGDALRGNSHTVVMALQFDENAASDWTRQWIFNLGQEGPWANHWLWTAGHHIQFGSWSGDGQITSPADAPHWAQTLATTYDGATNTYSLYADGVFVASKQMTLDIQNGNLQAGTKGNYGSDRDVAGCVRGVDVYRGVLSAAQVADASARLMDSTCGFTAHHDGVADGIIVMDAGTKRWNGCYDRNDAGRNDGAGGNYEHRAHSGSIYQHDNTWRIAVSGQYTSYQAPNIRSSVVPRSGWAAGLDTRTPAGDGDSPAPNVRVVFA